MSYPGRDDLDPRLVELRRNRWARELADLRTDYAILDAWNAGATIRDFAAACGLSQDEVTWRVQHRPDQIHPWSPADTDAARWKSRCATRPVRSPGPRPATT